MICAQELLVWLNSKSSIVERIADFAGLVSDGYVRLDSDGDAIVGLAATAAAPAPLTLPVADC